MMEKACKRRSISKMCISITILETQTVIATAVSGKMNDGGAEIQ